MLLLDTQTLRVKTFIGQQTPRYAILSHTWGDDELSLQALQSGGAEHTNGYVKVSKFCRIARENGHRYAWVDTCCIDKTSSAELSEAINSMFQWYRKAAVCYTYLSDLDPGDSHQLQTALPDCRWFKRGWTLQELLAPKELHFYDSEWNERGTKAGLITSLSNITATRISALENADELYCLPAAEKMSWASRRTTTRAEDMAYCLLGILDVQMGLLYGEGPKAFRRLQEEVMRKTNDMSLLAWIPVTAGDEMREIWARSPVEFSWIVEQAVQLDVTSQWNTELDITSKGLRLST
ncbi:heterokaryon incompatibility protein-domain-containing protein, partial [Cladorrhinum sp. PSN332]